MYQSWFFKDLPIGCIAESDLDTDYVMQDSKATPVHVDIPHSMVISLWPTLSLAEVLCMLPAFRHERADAVPGVGNRGARDLPTKSFGRNRSDDAILDRI